MEMFEVSGAVGPLGPAIVVVPMTTSTPFPETLFPVRFTFPVT